MTTPVPMTELEAVNLMLSVVGEAPVNTLVVSGLSDVAIAKNILSETSRSVQERGWHFNTEDNYTLAVDGDGSLPVPANVLRIDPMRDEQIDLVQRGTRMYDRENHTFTIGRSVKFAITFGLPFDQLPQAARHYIAVKAARSFQKQTLGSQVIEAFTQDDEMAALLAMKDQETDTGDFNLLTGSWDTLQILER